MAEKELIKMTHGAGGRVMQDLVGGMFLEHLGGLENIGPGEVAVPLSALEDSAVVDGIVFTTDGHTVKPLFFPGGDIGSLSVAGTVNDLCVMGAEPLALSLGLVLEDGYPMSLLEDVVKSIARSCRYAGVPVVTGDTKVVERGGVDGMVVNTAGLGRRSPFLDANFRMVEKYRPNSGRWLLDSNLVSGDVLILSGSVADHGVALLSRREGYAFDGDIKSDICPLNHLIEEALKVGGVVSMKDPTRGGLANALNEMAEKCSSGILVVQDSIPIKPAVMGATEMLGLDPLEIGNEGKVVIGVVKEMAEDVLKAVRARPEGKDARIIGFVTDEVDGVVMETLIGGRRYVEMPVGDPIPRIC